MTERFTLLEKIGRGGMGVVWRARDEETGQIVALKLLHSAYSDDPDYVTRFERELELARRIKSPNVVGVLGFGVLDGTPYLALEYVDGPTLRQCLVKHGPYTWDETKALLAQITRGLADAHAAGVVHRDIKPSNILIGSDGVAKIADFGIARGLDLTRVTGTSTLLGTPAYLPPEGPQDERSDLYSLGIVAYELLAGVPPFEGSTYAEVLMAHVRLAPDLDKLPADARPIVGRLLAKEPKGRPQSATELLAVLEGTRAVPSATANELAAAAGIGLGAAGADTLTGSRGAATKPPADVRHSVARRRVPVALTLGALVAVLVAGSAWAALGGSAVTPQRTSSAPVGGAQQQSDPNPGATLSGAPTGLQESIAALGAAIISPSPEDATPTPTPTPTPSPLAPTTTVSVPAIQAAGVIGPTIQAGDVVTIKASGIWCMGGDTECGGADGIRFADVVKETDMVLASSKMGTLLGQFGSATPFPLGSSATFTAPTSGTLKLLFNDRRCCYADNTRSLTVEVWVNAVLGHRISSPVEAAIGKRTESQWIPATPQTTTSANRSECVL